MLSEGGRGGLDSDRDGRGLAVGRVELLADGVVEAVGPGRRARGNADAAGGGVESEASRHARSAGNGLVGLVLG